MNTYALKLSRINLLHYDPFLCGKISLKKIVKKSRCVTTWIPFPGIMLQGELLCERQSLNCSRHRWDIHAVQHLPCATWGCKSHMVYVSTAE
ncbi:unnamed protein product [Phytomonas sp. Hart1]|nr:unnamed protein product [Phytomonas sp. Hart1]|eukprot:CCW70642.1 unnamed protein product [Phytomonas sp. isolate Hart1]